MKKLSEIKVEKQVVVKKLLSSGKYRLRLMEMGVIVGSKVEIIKVSPLGDPLTILVRGYELTLRKSELDLILVEELQ